MAARSQTSSKKRQKELARQEKQKEKFARRAQRKLEKHLPDAGGVSDSDSDSVPPDSDAAAPDSDAAAPGSEVMTQ